MDYPVEERADIIKKAEEDISKVLKAQMTRSLLTTDIIDNATNTSMSLLAKTLHQTWAESFLAFGQIKVKSSRSVKIECQEYNHHHRGPGTVFVDFSFN